LFRSTVKRATSVQTRLLIGCLVWLVSQAPLPVCHAHAGEPASLCGSGLEQHLQTRHPNSQLDSWFDWHLHWLTPREVRSGCLPGSPGDEPAEPSNDVLACEAHWLSTAAAPASLIKCGTHLTRFEAASLDQPGLTGLCVLGVRNAGSFLAVHRTPGAVRKLTGVALC
jgi:hypothetical protein